MEGHGFKREDRFARLVHGLDLRFKASRGGCRSKLTVRTYKNRGASNSDAIDPSDEGSRLPRGHAATLRADADGAGLARNAFVADLDIVTAGGEIFAGSKTNPDIVAAGGVVKEGIESLSDVASAGSVTGERKTTVANIATVGGVRL